MPQMMPINWIMSFIFFICIFLFFNILNYYIFQSKINNLNKKFNKFLKNFSWKW